MTPIPSRPPVAPGELAPEFSLAAVDRPGSLSLTDYRGSSPLFLALFVGLWCPFCRRAIAQMNNTESKLKALGVETVGVVATSLENAQLYFKFRPTRMRLASDPELSTHRAYGVPKPVVTPELLQQVEGVRINPFGAFPEPLPVAEASVALAKADGYPGNDTDRADTERQWPQLKGQFLIDRNGIVRWVNIECGADGLAGLGRFPTEEEILAAARTLPQH
jgi:peroxiredoxin